MAFPSEILPFAPDDTMDGICVSGGRCGQDDMDAAWVVLCTAPWGRRTPLRMTWGASLDHMRVFDSLDTVNGGE